MAAVLGDCRHPSKDAAAHAAGISMATLMRWQGKHPELHGAWTTASRGRYLRRQAAKAQRALLPRPPAPTRQMRLVCWFLVHRVRPLASVTLEHMRRACLQVNLSFDAWKAACHRFPQLLASVASKRARRRAYLLEHGEILDGWTPPDPTNYRTAARATGSFAQRRGTFMASIFTHERQHSSRHDDPWL